MNAISVSKYIGIRTYDVNMIANALAVSTIPVVPDEMEVQGLVEDRHYVRESKYTDDLKHSNMKNNCRRYENEIAPDMIIKKLLNHVFVGASNCSISKLSVISPSLRLTIRPSSSSSRM